MLPCGVRIASLSALASALTGPADAGDQLPSERRTPAIGERSRCGPMKWRHRRRPQVLQVQNGIGAEPEDIGAQLAELALSCAQLDYRHAAVNVMCRHGGLGQRLSSDYGKRSPVTTNGHSRKADLC